MTTKKTPSIFSWVLTALLASFVIISCNNSGDEKKDAATPAATTPPDSLNKKKDTLPMDTADTKPVKTINEQ